MACLWGPEVELRIPKVTYKPANPQTPAPEASFHPPSLPPAADILDSIPLLNSHNEQLEGRDMSEFCPSPQIPAQELEHRQPLGMAWQAAQADTPYHTPGLKVLLKARPCPDCSYSQTKGRSTLAFLLLAPKCAQSQTGTSSGYACPVGVQVCFPTPGSSAPFRENSAPWSGPGTIFPAWYIDASVSQRKPRTPEFWDQSSFSQTGTQNFFP